MSSSLAVVDDISQLLQSVDLLISGILLTYQATPSVDPLIDMQL